MGKDMLLYTFAGAISPARVKFFMAEKGVEIPEQAVNLMALEHKKPEYRKISPNGRVPALQLDSGDVLCETVAICAWLESEYPEPNLLGRTPLECAQLQMWARIMELELMMPMAMAFRHLVPAMKMLEQQVPEFGTIQHEVAFKRIRRLDRELADKPWVAGDVFSLADITAWCSFKFFRPARFTVDETTPNLLAWFKRVGERPAAAVAFT